MKPSLIVRPAQDADAPQVAHLIQGVAHYFVSAPSGLGAEGFPASISEAAIAGYIKSADFHYIIALAGDEIAGVAALKGNQHVYHLFVHPAFHRQGIAASLWHALKTHAAAAGNRGRFTVNSSLYAVPVYARFGFIAAGMQQEKSGMQFQPMTLAADFRDPC